MKRTILSLTYTTFIIASLALVFVFVTSKTYTQLAIATLAYPLLVFLAYKTLPRAPKINVGAADSNQLSQLPQTPTMPQVAGKNIESVGISDIDRRVFLKLIGATGLSFFLVSLFARGTEAPFFDKILRGGKKVDDVGVARDGYTISEVDDGAVGYYGFINNAGAWYIMREDLDGGSFRYARGEADFKSNWASRENLQYDYYNDTFNAF